MRNPDSTKNRSTDEEPAAEVAGVEEQHPDERDRPHPVEPRQVAERTGPLPAVVVTRRLLRPGRRRRTRSRIAQPVTSSIASTTIRPDIFEVPRTRSWNVMGCSTMPPPVRATR